MIGRTNSKVYTVYMKNSARNTGYTRREIRASMRSDDIEDTKKYAEIYRAGPFSPPLYLFLINNYRTNEAILLRIPLSDFQPPWPRPIGW